MSVAPLLRALPYETDFLALHRGNPQRYPCLLESVLHGTPQARYDFLFAFPGEHLTLGQDLRLSGRQHGAGDFLQAFDRWWREEGGGETAGSESRKLENGEPENDGPEAAIPFRGGWLMFLAYELAAQIEPVLALPRAVHSPVPQAHAVRVPAALIRDHQRRCCWLVAEPGNEALLEAMYRDAMHPVPFDDGGDVPRIELEEEDPAHYLAAVARIHEYILAGDVFQVNLSRCWRGTGMDPAADSALYRRLCRSNPAPFAGIWSTPDWAILSSSPERLVRVHRGRVETRPIAGTAPRRTGGSEEALAQRLSRHPKERAEHIMLIDLERNDLGRIAEPGSVHVNELLVLESYAYVHHLVSNVRGRLRSGVTPGEVLRAVFPGGTITGCPKVRCMQIIAELEGMARGPYTGAMGYVNLDGELDFNILIRTLVREHAQLSLRAGAGIVADSIPERELAETRAKARGLLKALDCQRPDIRHQISDD